MDRDEASSTARGLATRARILNCGLRLMWRYGYSEIGINRLIEEAGVLKGSFYHFFPSKMDLLLAMYDHLWAIQRRQIEKIYKTKASPEAALLEHIDWICRAQIQARKEQGFVPGLLHMAAGVTLLEDNPALAEKVRGMSREHQAFFADTFRRIAPHNAARADQAAEALGNFLGGAILNARVTNSLEPIHAVRDIARWIVDSLKEMGAAAAAPPALLERQRG